MSDQLPALDFTRITFPSDRLTVGALRKLRPEAFDVPRKANANSFAQRHAYNRASLEFALGDLIDGERVVASLAFKTALGQPLTEDETLQPPDEVLKYLATDYEVAGLAHGAHHAQELIREIEAQALKQAELHTGQWR